MPRGEQYQRIPAVCASSRASSTSGYTPPSVQLQLLSACSTVQYCWSNIDQHICDIMVQCDFFYVKMVTQVRLALFWQRGRSVKKLTPTTTVLSQYIRRAVLQPDNLLGDSGQQPGKHCLAQVRGVENVDIDMSWIPNWTTLPETSITCSGLLTVHKLQVQ